MSYRKDAEDFILSIESLYDPSHHANDLNIIIGLIKDRKHTGQEFVDAMPGVVGAGAALGVDLGLILCDSAVSLASLFILHRVLREASQANFPGGPNQAAAHKWVDLFSHIESAHALYFDVIADLGAGSLAAHPSESLSRLEVLAKTLQGALGGLAQALVPAVGAGATAPLVDYCQELLLGEEMLKLSGALDKNIDELAV